MVRLKDWNEVTCFIDEAVFQFQYGSIKRLGKKKIEDEYKDVSIPIWFD